MNSSTLFTGTSPATSPFLAAPEPEPVPAAAPDWPATHLVPNIPTGYVQPTHPRYAFRPGCGGNSIWVHMARLAEVARLAPQGVLLEVGVGCGDGSTHAFALGLAQNPALATRMHVGVNIHPPSGDWTPTSSWWAFVEGDSREVSTAALVQNALTLESDGGASLQFVADVIYIDTAHDYPTVKREIELYSQFGGPDTLWLFHDTYLSGSRHPLTDAIEEAVAPGGVLFGTHRYYSITEECSGLGALIPLKGWPAV